MGTAFPSELYARFFTSLRDSHSDLKTASLVCHQFRHLAQTHLFATFRFNGKSKQLGEKVSVLGANSYRLANYVCSLQLHLSAMQFEGVERPVAGMLPYFTSATILFMDGVESLASLKYNRWGLVNQHLRDSLIEHLFPRLNVLSIEWQRGLPFISILNACSNLRHLSLRQFEGISVSLPSHGASVTPRQPVFKPHPLESLIVGTYSSEDFENDNSLITFIDNTHCELRKIQLRFHPVHTDVNSPTFTTKIISKTLYIQFSFLFQLTEVFSSVRRKTSNIERIHLLRFKALEVLQVEIYLYGPNEYYDPPQITMQESLWWRGPDHFFKWIALKLEEVQSPATRPFRRVLLDLRLEGPMTVPVDMAKVDSTVVQNVL
ncbi:hypothetical protein DL96DRAFT_1719477 [Flagelloscypha sp. PMI_526]|nr:hypothetical protein DL96DRAFT_1719477 [Flagelloscypha sp. PMI_526]